MIQEHSLKYDSELAEIKHKLQILETKNKLQQIRLRELEGQIERQRFSISGFDFFDLDNREYDIL